MTNLKKYSNLHCCIGIPVKFSDDDIKILRIADISTADWNKNRVNSIGKIYTDPDGGTMLIPVNMEKTPVQSDHDNVGLWVWKENDSSEGYDAVPYSVLHKKINFKYTYYELIFLKTPESPENLRLLVGSDDEFARVLENGIVVPDTFSDNLLVIYDYNEEDFFCVEINKATSCIRYNQLLFVIDKKSLNRYNIKRTDVIDSFDPKYNDLLSENSVDLNRRLIYTKMKISQNDKLDSLSLHTDSARFARYFYHIATRLNYSENEKKLVNKITTEALSNLKLQPILTESTENKQRLEYQIKIINSYLNTDDKVEEFVSGVITHFPKINEEYVAKMQPELNQVLLEQKVALESEISNLNVAIDELNGEILVIKAEKTAETDALKSLRKTVESEGDRERAALKIQIEQELKEFEKDLKKSAVGEIETLKKEQMQALDKECEEFRADQRNIILNDIKFLREEYDNVQNDIALLRVSKEQLQNDISDNQYIREELSKLEQNKSTLEEINEQLKSSCELKLRNIQENPGEFLGDLALFKGLMQSGVPEKTSVASSPNSNLFVQSAKKYGSDPSEIINPKELIDYLIDNLLNIGVSYEYSGILAEFIAGAYFTRTPLLLTGCNANLMAQAISVTLCSQTPEVISVPTGYNDYSSLINIVKNACGNVVILQNVIGSIDEYCYTHLARDIHDENPEKYIIFSLDFAENIRILPSSVLGYMALINSEDVITSIKTEILDPGNCAIAVPVERNLEEVKTLYGRIVDLSRGTSVTNGYNLTRAAIFSAVAKKDRNNEDAALILELGTYCKLLGTADELNQRLEYLSRGDLKEIVEKLLGGK
ncbi:hypothetical protein [Methanoplanus endosymbiosus]|uniref:Uncharacterized protein n=1 Tax=Methanoplanus endosymbiosus TaxID=33865 RepID=A0A9E7PJW2_9EURY|nr:hypothetical protein [Methanoplanus endosymbiosus]UUX91218.1 hypothetical protein L6E24_07445 [Methanoplanus endosymbiosus]